MSSRKTNFFTDLKLVLDSSVRDTVVTSIVLEQLVKGLGGVWGAYWYVDEASELLRFSQSWHTPEFNPATLDEHIQKRTFTSGEGMPGTVWRTRKAEWSRDIVKDMMLPRSLKALNAGLEAGMWIPIVNINGIFGVVEILGCRNDLLTNGLAQFLQTIGEEIGDHIAYS